VAQYFAALSVFWTPRGSSVLRSRLFEEAIMSDSQLLSSVFPLPAIERPACPKCQTRMMLARIMPALLGTTLRTFECSVCNHVLKTLAACEDTLWSGELNATVKRDVANLAQTSW
jgi:hypothetical protein